MTDAEICRTNGWKVGDVLEGADVYGGVTRIQITAIGQRNVLAVKVRDTGQGDAYEHTWSLQCRPWRKVGEA